MKKNLLSIVILALVIVNLALTGVMMFSTMSANQKTTALVNQIATILDFEVKAEAEEAGPSIFDTDTYNIQDEMVITLKPGGDSVDHYAIVSVSLSLDKTDENYEQYQPLIAEKESKIVSVISSVFGQYTKEEASANSQAIANEILNKLQDMFESKFIYEVYFRDIKFQ